MPSVSFPLQKGSRPTAKGAGRPLTPVFLQHSVNRGLEHACRTLQSHNQVHGLSRAHEHVRGSNPLGHTPVSAGFQCDAGSTHASGRRTLLRSTCKFTSPSAQPRSWCRGLWALTQTLRLRTHAVRQRVEQATLLNG
jgi:hypothetical protein